METIRIILIFLTSVVFSGVIERILPLPIPRPLVQISIGVLIAFSADMRVTLEPDVFFLLFLPPLLFADGWRIPKEGLFRDIGTILELALGLVVFTVLGIGFLIHWMIPVVPLPVAFALAAILSPTDPVAVSAIASRVSVPRRLLHILEGESLLNDASGLVCMRFAVAAALSGTFSLSAASLTFLWLAIAGIGIGIVVSWGVTTAKNWVSGRFGEDPGSQIIVSLLIPFIAYLTAEGFEASGILAAVSAGMTMSYRELTGQATATTRIWRNAVWSAIQFALNGIMFVLLGEQLPQIISKVNEVAVDAGHGNAVWLVAYVLIINLALAAMRFLWVWVSLRFTLAKNSFRGDSRRAPPWRLVAAISVAGSRGAITLAGILTLPLALNDGTEFPSRDLVIFLAACVVIVSLVVASVGLPFLLKGVDLPIDPSRQRAEEEVRITAAEAAIRAVEEARHRLAASSEREELYAAAAARIVEIYGQRIAGYASEEPEEAENYIQARKAEQQMWLEGLRAERREVFKAARAHRISDEISRRLVREIDLIEARLSDG